MPATAGATKSTVLVTGLDVLREDHASGIIVLADSRVDGHGSTPGLNHRWVDVLAEHLVGGHRAVVNEGIAGGRLLHDFIGTNALGRVARDVLSNTGV